MEWKEITLDKTQEGYQELVLGKIETPKYIELNEYDIQVIASWLKQRGYRLTKAGILEIKKV